MLVVFPAHPVTPSRPDPAFESEVDAARAAGFAVGFASLEGSSEAIQLRVPRGHSKSRMPLVREFRCFVLDGKLVTQAPYWGEGEYEGTAPSEDVIASVDVRAEPLLRHRRGAEGGRHQARHGARRWRLGGRPRRQQRSVADFYVRLAEASSDHDPAESAGVWVNPSSSRWVSPP